MFIYNWFQSCVHARFNRFKDNRYLWCVWRKLINRKYVFLFLANDFDLTQKPSLLPPSCCAGLKEIRLDYKQIINKMTAFVIKANSPNPQSLISLVNFNQLVSLWSEMWIECFVNFEVFQFPDDSGKETRRKKVTNKGEFCNPFFPFHLNENIFSVAFFSSDKLLF